jgi:hypothetical protein
VSRVGLRFLATMEMASSSTAGVGFIKMACLGRNALIYDNGLGECSGECCSCWFLALWYGSEQSLVFDLR